MTDVMTPAASSTTPAPRADGPPGADRRSGTGSAIACSGGGIRSASYNLGALQALAREGVLQREVSLVSAVSGGSYIASSYLLVAAPRSVAADGGTHGVQQVPLGDAYAPGSPEERHVRQHTRYLLPSAASGLRAVLCVVFGLALNLSLLVGWIVAVVLPLGWAIRAYGVTTVARDEVDLHLVRTGWAAVAWSVPAVLLGATLVLFALSSSWVSTYHRRRWHPDRSTVCPPAQGCETADDEQGLAAWLSCGGAQRAMWWTFAGAAGSAYLLLVAPWLVDVVTHVHPSSVPSSSPGGVGAGLGSFFVALLATVRLVLGSVRGDKGREAVPDAATARLSGATRLVQGLPSTLWRRLQHGLMPWVGSAIAVGLLVAVSLLALDQAVRGGPTRSQLLVEVAVVAYLLLARVAVDVNRTSLHSLYRDRLASAYAVRRGTGEVAQPAGQARLSQLQPRDGSPLPELVVCATANITAVGEVPAGRNGVSFTFTPRDAGLERPLSHLHARPESDALYRRVPTADYEHVVGLRHLTLLDVVAISGAAVSPVMGSSTRAAERLLLALANVRLGVWLPHPALMPVHDPTAHALHAPALGGGGGHVRAPRLGEQPVAAVPADRVELRMLRRLTGRRGRQLADVLVQRLELGEHEERLAELERELDEARRAGAALRAPGAPRPAKADRKAARARVADVEDRLRRAQREQHVGLWPRLVNELSWRVRQPNLRLLLVEALGATSLGDRWLYVTDGGHYENLGLVEALRRRPAEAFVFDASADRSGTWATIGEAVALARAELGVDISIEPDTMTDGHGEVVQPFVRGSYRYADGGPHAPERPLWLCKLGVPKGAPWDVRAFALTHPSFPTDSTLKQLYDGREFEAYRALGDHAASRMLAARRAERASVLPAATAVVPAGHLAPQHRWGGLLWFRAGAP